jgi:hypothetical protein
MQEEAYCFLKNWSFMTRESEEISSFSTVDLVTISNFSKGGLAINGGTILINKGEFSENSPQLSKYPSMRRNAICQGKGEMNISSLQGGDGVSQNSSLFIHHSFDCSFHGILEERISLFFISTLNEITNNTEDGSYILSFKGSCFFPCSLSLWLISFADSREEKFIETFKYQSETLILWFDEKNVIDLAANNVSVFGSVKCQGQSEQRIESEIFLLRNIISIQQEKNTDTMTQSTVDPTQNTSTLFVCIIILLCI